MTAKNHCARIMASRAAATTGLRSLQRPGQPGGRLRAALAASTAAFALLAAEAAAPPAALADNQRPRQASAAAYDTDLKDTLETAFLTSPELAAQRQVVRGLDEGVTQARAGFRPTISAGVSGTAVANRTSEGPVESTEGGDVTVSVSASQTLFNGFQTSNSVNAANKGVEGGRFTLFSVEQSVLLSAIVSYINILTAEQNVRIAKNNVAVISRQLQAARDRFEVGEVTRTDVAQAEAALAESRANLASQEGLLRTAGETFQNAVGVPAGRLAPLPPIPELPDSLEEAKSIALQRNPTILASRASVEGAGFSVSAAEGALLPQVGLSGSFSATANSIGDAGSTSASTTISVTVPIFTGGSLRSAVRESKAAENEAFQNLRDAARQVSEDVGEAWQDLVTARATIRSNLAQIRAEQIAFEGVQEEAKVGSRTTLDVLEAEEDLLEARLALVTSRANEQIFAYTLLSAMGVLSIETLNLQVARENPDVYYNFAQGFITETAVDADPGELDDDWMNNWHP